MRLEKKRRPKRFFVSFETMLAHPMFQKASSCCGHNRRFCKAEPLNLRFNKHTHAHRRKHLPGMMGGAAENALERKG